MTQRPFLAALTLSGLLGGCTYGMHDAVFGHGDTPTDTPEVMAADTRDMLARLENYCYSGKPVWDRRAVDTASCTFTVRSRWAFGEGRQGWFEAMTRGVDTFGRALEARYPYSTKGAASGGHTAKRQGTSTAYYSWAYLLGDGSTQLRLSREWGRTWNGFDTAVVEESVLMRMTLHTQDACIRDLPRDAKVAPCPGMRAALSTPPEQLDAEALQRIQRQSIVMERFLAATDAARQERDAVRGAVQAYRAAEARASQQAVEQGIRQGLASIAPPTAQTRSVAAPAASTTPVRPPLPARVQVGADYKARLEARARQLAEWQAASVPAAGVAVGVVVGAAPVAPQAAVPGKVGVAAVGGLAAGSASPSSGGAGAPGTPAASAPTMLTYQEAAVYCWASQKNRPPAAVGDERWFCHGPVQRTWAAETLAKALTHAGCASAHTAARQWPFGEGTLYACGFGREAFDDDVVARYGVPGTIVSQLHTYRCAVPRNGRCQTRP